LPPLIITETDCDWIEQSFEAVIADAHRVPGAIWSLGKTLLANVARACATA
jgi:ornithine--oxo-acid transaminase